MTMLDFYSDTSSTADIRQNMILNYLFELQGGAKVVGQCVKLINQMLLVRAQILLAQNIPKPLF